MKEAIFLYFCNLYFQKLGLAFDGPSSFFEEPSVRLRPL